MLSPVSKCLLATCLMVCVSYRHDAAAADAGAEETAAESTAAARSYATAESDEASDTSPSGHGNLPRGRFELKRLNTARGTPSESTRTTLRLDTFLNGPVSLLRLDLPFVDNNTSTGTSPFDPRQGDLKVRVGFRSVRTGLGPVASFVEVIFPTANPESLGSGKYQFAPAVGFTHPLRWAHLGRAPGASFFHFEAQQWVSVAGDPSAKDINYTKLSFDLRDTWHDRYSAKWTFKEIVDWMQSGKTGGLFEFEGGWRIDRTWNVTLVLGTRLWGEGIPGTYSTKTELTLGYMYW